MRLALADKPELKEQALKRFLREARALASVDSPHVVHVHDFGRTEQDDYYLVMDYIEGGSLHDLLRRFGKFRRRLRCTSVFKWPKPLELPIIQNYSSRSQAQ